MIVFTSQFTGANVCSRVNRPANTPVDRMCGCTGVSPTFKVPWNVILAQHSGTGTLVEAFNEAGASTCVHEHTFQLLHEQDMARVSAYCKKHKKKIRAGKWESAPQSTDFRVLCDAVSKPEILIALVRNPFRRILSSAAFHGKLKMSKPINECVGAFRTWVMSPERPWVPSVTSFLTVDNTFRRPNYVINNRNDAEYLEELLNILRLMGYDDPDQLDMVRKNLTAGAGHHIARSWNPLRNYKTIPVADWYDNTSIASILEEYHDDFDYFNLERDVRKLVW